jgi:MFS family permease
VPDRDAAGTPGLRDVFAIAHYRRLWSARTVSQWGDTFNFVALALLIYDLTGSGLGVTGVVVAEILPVLLLAPLAGPLIDRWPRVAVMVAADLFRLVLMVLLVVWHDSAVGVYGVAFGMSVGMVFFNPAAGSVLPAIVSRNRLVAANSGIWTAAVVSQIAIAPLAGLVVTTVGYAPAFALNAASYAVSALVLRGLRLPGTVSTVERRGVWAEAREGIRVVAGHRLLRALAVGQSLAALSAGATSALLVVLAEEHLGVTGAGYGFLIAAIGVGAAIGPLVLVRRLSDPSRAVFVFGPFALRGVVDLVLAAVTAVPVAAAALVVYGVGTSTGAVTFNSMLQAQAPEHARGRVFAAMDVIWQAGRLISLGVGGLLADLYGIQVVYYLGGLLLLAAAAAGRLTRPAG